MSNNKSHDPKSVYITYIDNIDVAKVSFLMAQISKTIKSNRPDKLHILFSSQGGDVSAGIAPYNFLKSLPCEILMYNIGICASIATAIFCAPKPENRFACPHTSFLFHGVKQHFVANTQLNLELAKELASNFTRDQERIAEIMTSNTKMTKEQVDALFIQGEVKNLDQAITDGIIASVQEIKIPINAQHEYLAFGLQYIRQQ